MKDNIANDTEGMAAALAWSAAGRGTTSPRPSVGCVLVRDGRVLGGGHTQPGDGNPHAEIVALRQAAANGHDPKGATAYVTLEPCSHVGTTPPCSSALIAAGVARVVAGVRDPNPLIDGRGYRLLREAGIEVVEGFAENECARAQDHFLKYIATSQPFVTLKCAVSLDGKIATASGESRWISGPESREFAHRMRADHDAVLVGSKTALTDDPLLTVRIGDEKISGRPQPARIVLNSDGSLADRANKLRFFATGGRSESDGETIVVVTEAAGPERRDKIKATGARVVVVPADVDTGKVDLSQALRLLPEFEIYSVLMEGGAEVAASALVLGVADKVVFFVAPMLLGGDGIDAVASLGLAALADAPRLRDIEIERLGDDVMIAGYTRPLPGTSDYVHRTH